MSTMDDIKRALHITLYRCLSKTIADVLEEDIEAIITALYGKEIADGVDALHAIFEAYHDEKTGELLTRIRGAEGIDPDMIDQILGVQPDDL